MARNEDGYDWLNDPFDERKAGQQKAGMPTGAKVGIGIGCFVALVLMVVLVVFGAAALAGLMRGL